MATHIDIDHVHHDAIGDNSNAVVWLTPLEGGKEAKPVPNAKFTISQKDKQFIPHVLAVPIGTKIQFPNKDPFFHNVFSLYQGKKFDLGLYEAGSSREVLFDKPGVSFIFCNIHPNMSAYVLALDTNYFDVTRKDGQVRIENVPPGKYRLQVWYERAEDAELARLTRMLEVGESNIKVGTIHVKESPKFQPEHSNKHGKPYDPEPPPY
ncbi:MAG TPA: hypothetical protein VN577_07595 [Terriglobales bacterium]|nr:hypothetical protein [Terriglobales bacterium]